MTSRRESRSSIGARQNDALFEFENFKKKFLLANKHITKLNSTLSVRIEELNSEISRLYVENLHLRQAEIALTAQLKREREQSRKVLADAEVASQNLTKHLNYLRGSLGLKDDPPMPPTPPSPKARRPVQNDSTSPTTPQFNRISRPPNIPGIHEEEEPIPSTSEEQDKPTTTSRKKVKSKPRLSASKLPLPARGPSPTPTSTSGNGSSSSHHVDLSAVAASSRPRKTIRRQSGLLTVNTEAFSVPRSGSPAFGSPIRLEAGRAEEEEEMAAVHGELLVEVVDQDELAEVVLLKEKRKGKAKEQQRESESERDSAPREKKKTREAEDPPEQVVKPKSLRNALQPIDSNDEPLDVESKAASQRQFLTPVSPAGSAPTSRGSSSPAPPDNSEGAGGRERRTRKSVNYAEPKLNTKMRKPDPPTVLEPTRKKRSSAAAVMTTSSYKPPSSSSSNGADPGNDADGDTEARSSLEFAPPLHTAPSAAALPLRGMNGNYINPELFPLPSSRPGSAAALYSPGPPTRTTGSTTSSTSTATTSSNTNTYGVSSSSSSSTAIPAGPSTTTAGVTVVKRKKSRPQLPLSDEESDGAEADAEYIGSLQHTKNLGAGISGSAAWMNVHVDTGRRKGVPKRNAAAAAVAALEDIRRHSMAI